MSLAAAALLALAAAAVAGTIAVRTARGSMIACLAGQLAALSVRVLALLGIAVLLRLRWPDDLIPGLSIAAVVVLGGLVLDATRLIRIVRAPAKECVRA